MQNGTSQRVAQFRNRKLQKAQQEHLLPKQLCVMFSALPQLQQKRLFSEHMKIPHIYS